jgi:hypothetical protein
MKRAAAALLACALLAGCASTKPVTHYYSLMPKATAAGTLSDIAPSRYFELLPVSVPTRVDQPQFVVELPDGTLTVLEQQRWISPLREEIRDALSDRLTRRFAQTHPVDADAGTPRSVWRVRVDIQRFESVPGRYARVDAAWSLRSPTDAVSTLICRNAFEEPAGPDYASLAEAHRDGVIKLGDTIADTLLRLRAGGAAMCP